MGFISVLISQQFQDRIRLIPDKILLVAGRLTAHHNFAEFMISASPRYTKFHAV